MQFDVVATNPPFQDYTNKKKTQHLDADQFCLPPNLNFHIVPNNNKEYL